MDAEANGRPQLLLMAQPISNSGVQQDSFIVLADYFKQQFKKYMYKYINTNKRLLLSVFPRSLYKIAF